MPPRMHPNAPKIQAAGEKLQDPFKEQEILLMSEHIGSNFNDIKKRY